MQGPWLSKHLSNKCFVVMEIGHGGRTPELSQSWVVDGGPWLQVHHPEAHGVSKFM